MTLWVCFIYFKNFYPRGIETIETNWFDLTFNLVNGTSASFVMWTFLINVQTVSLYIGMTIRMNINELNLVQKGPSWIETIFMQIKEVAARYKNLLILSSVITEVTSHYGDFKMHGIPWKYHWIYFNCFYIIYGYSFYYPWIIKGLHRKFKE